MSKKCMNSLECHRPKPSATAVTDTPPLGVTVLSFEVSVTGATLRSGLSNMDTVSVRGLLFNNGANPPLLEAKKVRKR